MNNNFGVYKITNKINKKVYIGSTGSQGLEKRWKKQWNIVRSIRKEKQEGLSLSQLAAKYNVKKAAIWKVINNYSWKIKEYT